MERKVIIAIAVFISIFSISALRAQDMCRAPVSTAQGPVVGTPDDGPGVCVYKGIPYAAAPVGDLRWKPPRPAP